MNDLTLEKALQIVNQALDNVQANGPDRRLIDKAYLLVAEAAQANTVKGESVD